VVILQHFDISMLIALLAKLGQEKFLMYDKINELVSIDATRCLYSDIISLFTATFR